MKRELRERFIFLEQECLRGMRAFDILATEMRQLREDVEEAEAVEKQRELVS